MIRVITNIYMVIMVIMAVGHLAANVMALGAVAEVTGIALAGLAWAGIYAAIIGGVAYVIKVTNVR